MKKYEVNEDFIKQAHAAACSEWKMKIREQFPEVFKPKLFEFGTEFVFDVEMVHYRGGERIPSPIIIAHGLARTPEERGHAIILNGESYDISIETHPDRPNFKIVTFKTKY